MIGQLHCNNSAVGTTEVKCVLNKIKLLTPRLLQTSYVNALILESRSIIISSFNFKEL